MTSLVIHVKNENVFKSSAQQRFPKKKKKNAQKEGSHQVSIHLDNGGKTLKAF